MHSEVLIDRPLSALSGTVGRDRRAFAVRIDCTRSPVTALESVLQWISACPERGAMHVILPSLRGQAAHRRALGSLQRLGCRVTLRQAQGHPERSRGMTCKI